MQFTGRWRCQKHGRPPRYFEWDGEPKCPVCGRVFLPNHAGPIVMLYHVHLVIMHEDGPIIGREGRQYVACEPKRDCLARSSLDQFSASGDVRCVTCPACMSTRAYKEMAAACPEIAYEEYMRQAVVRPHG